MILINKNSSTTNILTLSEKTTLQNVVYLFEVINDQTNNKIYFIAPDISGNKERFNEFVITDNVVQTPLTGVVTFPLLGSYHFNIYEQISTTNLDPTGLNKVEYGKLKVVDTVVAKTAYTGNPTNIVVYGT